MRQKKATDIAFLDFSKASDGVLHEGILLQLERQGIEPLSVHYLDATALSN